MDYSTIKTKTINGFQWGIIDNLANSGITFIVGLVLANILTPEEFGVLAIVTVFINLSTTIIDGGFASALIRKIEANDDDYNTVFYSNIVTSIVLMFMFISGAQWIAVFFNQPVLEEVIPVMSIILLFNAGQIIHKTLLIKALDFRSQAIASFVASIISGVTGIIMALMGYGIWSLVFQQLARQFLLFLCLWQFNTWRPCWTFSKNCFHDLFGFSIKLLFASLINSLYKDMFLVVIGKIYSAKDLGYYNRSEQFNMIFSNNLTMVIQKVTLPVLSQFQNNVDQLRQVYRKCTIFSAMLTFPLVFFLAAAAEPIIITLVGEKWRPSIPYLQIMSLYGAIYPLQILNINILNVLKKSNYILKLEIIKKFLFIPVIIVGLYTSLKTMLWAAVIYYYFEFFLNGWYSKRLIGYSTFQQINDLKTVYFVSLSVSIIIWMFTILHIPYLAMLIIQIAAAILLYLFVYTILNHQEFSELKDICLKHLLAIVKRS